MLKSIYTQLWNRKRSNGWILLELLLVFCLLWYLVDYLFVLTCNYVLPSYQDTAHTWQVNIARFPNDHPDFISEENEAEAVEANYARILNHIRNYPGVEELAISFNHCTPGSTSFNGTSYRNIEDTTRELGAQILTIYPGEDFLKVFGHTTDNGRTPVSVKDFDWSDPKSIVLSRMAAEALFPGQNPIGKRLESKYEPEAEPVVVVGVIDDIKRFSTYRPAPIFYRQRALHAETIGGAEISVRSAASIPDARFYETFYKDMTHALRIGNFYLLSIFSYNDHIAQQDISFGHSNDRRIRISLMLFFLLNLLLCVIGTFWYRINVRKEEIGLRVAIGSSRLGIMQLFLLEGIALLSIVTIPAMIIEYQFVHAGLIETFGTQNSIYTFLPDKTFLRFLITNTITWLILAATIFAAIWLPANRAAQMPPAEALHYE